MDWTFRILLTTVIGMLVLAAGPQLVGTSTPEWNLQNDLFQNYIPDVCPVSTPNTPISVYIDFWPINLKSVNEKEQTVTFNGFIFMNWVDIFMKWNPYNYSLVWQFTVNPKKLWLPPIGLYNSVEKFHDTTTADGIYLRVDYLGNIQRQMLGEFTVTCDMDPTNFPFDVHTCGLQFTSSCMSDVQIRIETWRTSPLVMELYSLNGQWDIVNSTAVKDQVVPSQAMGMKFDRVTFSFKLRRKNMFHLLNIIIPLILTILLVPCLFLLPADSGEKLGLGVTVLLALSVFLLTLSDSTPETSAYVPLLTIFVTIQLIATALSIICSTLILRLHHNSTPKRPGLWLRNFVLGFLARVMCLGDQRKETKEAEDELSWATKSPNLRTSIADLKEKAKRDDEFIKMSAGNRKLLEHLEVMAQKVRDEEEATEVSDEWKRIAYVLDWVCFWIFSTGIIIVTTTIFVKGSGAPVDTTI